MRVGLRRRWVLAIVVGCLAGTLAVVAVAAGSASVARRITRSPLAVADAWVLGVDLAGVGSDARLRDARREECSDVDPVAAPVVAEADGTARSLGAAVWSLSPLLDVDPEDVDERVPYRVTVSYSGFLDGPASSRSITRTMTWTVVLRQRIGAWCVTAVERSGPL